MRIYYQIPLIFSLLLGAQANVFATSKLYVAKATVVIKENRPCVFIKKEEYPDDKTFVTGISFGDSDGAFSWKSDAVVPDNIESCLPLGGKGYIFKTPELYTLNIGYAWGAMMYARANFCLGKDEKGNYYFSKGGNGVCTNEPEDSPKPKTWWQKLFD